MNLRQLRRMTARIPKHIEIKEGPPAGETPEQALLREMKEARTQLLEAVKNKADATKLAELQRQVDAIDVKLSDRHIAGGGTETKSLAEEIFEHPEFKRLGETGGIGRAVIKIDKWQQKTLTNTAVGYPTSGVLTIDREPGIVSVQYRQLRIRDLLRSRPTDQAVVDFVKVSTFTNAASMQVEASAKGQSDMALQSVSERIRTLAHWIPVSKHCFQDVGGLAEAINGHLLYGLKLKEEAQLLAGSGAGEDLNGLITQATAFDAGLLGTSSWNRLDVIARAIQQAERSDFSVDVIVLHTDDFWAMALTKNANGDYLFGSPGAATVPRLWGRPVAVTNSIGSGGFLVGSSMTALIRDRQEAIIEVSNSHDQDFVKNMLAIRCEERLALQVMRPGAWIYGSVTTSP